MLATIARLTWRDYMAALQSLEAELSDTERRILRVHYQAPLHTITARRERSFQLP